MTLAVARSKPSRVGRRSVTAIAAWGTVGLLVLVAVLGPLFTPYAPEAQIARALLPIGSDGHPLGTDDLGRDQLTRLVYGARPLIGVAVVATVLASVVGTLAGLVAGYTTGWVSAAVMRMVDLVLAFPSILLIILFVTVIGSGAVALVAGIAVAMAPGFARLVRALTAREASRDYTHAAVLAGARTPRILLIEILPNLGGPLLVQCMTTVSVAAGFSAGMSYIGLGIQPPTADWGYMVQAGQQFMYTAPALVIIPALLTLVFVVACNLVGDDLRDRLDPEGRT